jgi:hypothetical protein
MMGRILLQHQTRRLDVVYSITAGRCVYYVYMSMNIPTNTIHRLHTIGKMYIKFACACAQTWGNAHVNYRHHPFFSIRWAAIPANPAKRYRPSTAGCRLYYARDRRPSTIWIIIALGCIYYVYIHVWRGGLWYAGPSDERVPRPTL